MEARSCHGIELTRNVMCGRHDHLAERLLPLYELIGDKFRASNYVQVDETPINCLEPGRGQTATGYRSASPTSDASSALPEKTIRGSPLGSSC